MISIAGKAKLSLASDHVHLASFPGVGESNAWYHLHTHARNFPILREIRIVFGRAHTTQMPNAWERG